MNKTHWLLIVALIATLCCGSTRESRAQGQNLVTNGSFELRTTGEPNKHIDTLTADREDLAGWRIVGRSVDWIGPTRWKASHGEHCLDIDAPGGIEQTIKTTPGQQYQLQFDLAGNVETEPVQKLLCVSVNGNNCDFAFDATGRTRQQLGWVQREVMFTAPGDTTTLSFVNASADPTASGVALDNVIVAEMKADRYAVRTVDKGVILVDGASGQTWRLMPYNGRSAWLPVDSDDPTERLRQLGAKVSVQNGIVREIDLTDSVITDSDLEIVGSLSSLEHLTLNGCRQLTDAGLARLQGLTGLKGLGLERTNVTDAGLANLSGLTELNYLSLNWTQVGDGGLKHLSRIANLGVLYLCDTKTADDGLLALKGLSKLQWLDLRGTQVTDTGIVHLSNLPRLRLLSLHGVHLTDAGVPPLTELPNLEVLTLSQTQVTDAGLPPLTKMPKLNDVDLTGAAVTPAGIDSLRRMLPNCRVRFEIAWPAAPTFE